MLDLFVNLKRKIDQFLIEMCVIVGGWRLHRSVGWYKEIITLIEKKTLQFVFAEKIIL